MIDSVYFLYRNGLRYHAARRYDCGWTVARDAGVRDRGMHPSRKTTSIASKLIGTSPSKLNVHIRPLSGRRLTLKKASRPDHGSARKERQTPFRGNNSEGGSELGYGLPICNAVVRRRQRAQRVRGGLGGNGSPSKGAARVRPIETPPQLLRAIDCGILIASMQR